MKTLPLPERPSSRKGRVKPAGGCSANINEHLLDLFEFQVEASLQTRGFFLKKLLASLHCLPPGGGSKLSGARRGSMQRCWHLHKGRYCCCWGRRGGGRRGPGCCKGAVVVVVGAVAVVARRRCGAADDLGGGRLRGPGIIIPNLEMMMAH